MLTVEISATVMLFIVQFFACCHLLVSFASQDRERGTLTAMALTPVSTAELLVARFLFHLAISIAASAAIVGILFPAALTSPGLWCVLVPTSLGLMAVGTIVATLARNQTTASLLTLCYMLFGGVVFYLATKFSAFRWVKLAMFEHYSFPLTYYSFKNSINVLATAEYAVLLILVTVWIGVAASLFHKRGWR